jgi:hypothetical protein
MKVKELYKTPYPIVNLKRRRLECLSYVIRMNQMGVTKEHFESKAEIRVGRLRLRLECMQKLDVKRQKQKANSGEVWASVVKEPKGDQVSKVKFPNGNGLYPKTKPCSVSVFFFFKNNLVFN